MERSGQIDILDVIEIAKRRWKISLLGAAAVAALAVTYIYFFVPPFYVSKGTILSYGKESTPTGGAVQILSSFRIGTPKEEVVQWEALLKTDFVAEKVAKKFGVGRLNYTVKPGGSLLTVEVTSHRADLAPQIVSSLFDELSIYLQEISNQKAENTKKFFEARLKEAEQAMFRLEGQLGQLRVTQAQREQMIQSKVLALLREQFEMAQIEAKRSGENFFLVDPPQIPLKAAGPDTFKMTMTAFLASFFGLFLFLIVFDLFRRELSARRFEAKSMRVQPKPERGEKSSWAN